MQSRVILQFCLDSLNRPNNGGSRDIYGPLNAMLRPPAYEHEVRYPISHARAQDNEILPAREASIWLHDSHRWSEIGPWDSTIMNDARMPRLRASDIDFNDPGAAYTEMSVRDEYYVIVSFLNIEDAALFRLRWMPAR